MPSDPNRLFDFARLAIEKLSDGAFLISKEGRLVYVNEAACRGLGYTRDELLGMSVLQINPELTQESWDGAWHITVRDKGQTIETIHRTKEGRTFPVEVLANYLEYEGEGYCCACARDITERRVMEKRMRQAEKMDAIGRLAGGIAHDFNNQLSGIVGYADLLLEELKQKPPLATLAQAILVAAKRAAGLTSQLLTFSRQREHRNTPVDLHQLIDDVVHMLRRSIDERIRITTKLAAKPAVTVGDPTQLQNAVSNLASNARDAMPDGGELTFSTSVVVLDPSYVARSGDRLIPGPYVQLSVADTGMGMDAPTQERLFEPFFTTKQKGKGTGMGLAAVYGTVKSHRGAIHVESEVGRGTEMKLYLPLANQPIAAEESGPARAQPLKLQARILLVEDEQAISKMVSEMLGRIGCSVRVARNGAEAIAIFRESYRDIDVVLLDLVMPTMGGKDTFLRLREIHPEVRAIITSGYSFDGEVQSILGLGAKGFIQKPFRVAELSRRIAEALGHEPA